MYAAIMKHLFEQYFIKEDAVFEVDNKTICRKIIYSYTPKKDYLQESDFNSYLHLSHP